jgi:hypothetical protein
MDIKHLNSIHLTYLTPLLKWRVMDLKSLREEGVKVPEYFNFCKIVRSLEKANILESYRHPFNRKKYVYLGHYGEGQLSLRDNPTALSKDTLLHDIKVSELARSFINLGWVNNIELEHLLNDKRNFRTQYKIIPDALIECIKKGVNCKIALELELTRKNNQRILEKAKQYQSGSFYHYVMYFFCNRSVMEKYISLITSELGTNELNRFMFFLDEEMSVQVTDLKNVSGIYKGKIIKLAELFA